ncbi:hypothetical protein [Virgibacillus sediminis]|uniref:Uncharacterized protein n=1 Tax=Virgibacillus sediminis TaxID=202260 RepID=A0ABV7A670_9BACI
MDEDKSYIQYFFNILNLSFGLIIGVVTIATYVNTKSWKDVCILLALFLILSLLITSFKILKDRRSIKGDYDELHKQHIDLKQEKKSIEEKFDKQSAQYDKNIKEINKHKEVTHVVETLVNASSPETIEGKRIINTLRYSIEKKLKDSE